MAEQFRPALTLTVTAAGSIAANRFVTPAGAQAGADANTLGVALSAASGAGERIPVIALGTAAVEAGAAISAGATVKSDSQGRAITWATSGAKIGIALEAASGAGQVIEVFLVPNVA
jgi:hypothetical protein